MRDLNKGVTSMKVTVCFGRVRVVVPCSDGSLSVGELRDKAISRFHKATGRPLSHWIHVRKLITSPDGAILDPNDRLRDVVDDRDQITVIFEDHNGSLVQHCGDGTSGSSMSASSPEMFHDDHVNENEVGQNYIPTIDETDVIITSHNVITGSKLRVRRGSEPALNVKESEARVSSKDRRNGTKSRPSHSADELQELDSDSGVSGSDTADRKKSPSVEVKNAQLLDVAYKNMIEAVNSDILICEVQNLTTSLKRPSTARKLPDKEGGFTCRNGIAFKYSSIEDLDCSSLGEAGGTAPPIPPRKTPPLALQKTIASGRTNTRLLGKQISLQLIKGQHGLGFTVTTRDNPAGGNCPIYVKNIKPQGTAIESGLLQPGDRLLQVNDIEVTGKSQSQVVSILRGISEGSTVDLVISRQELLESNLDQPPRQTICIDKSESVPTLDSRASGSELASIEEGNSATGDVDILVFDICLNCNSAVKGLGVKLKGKATSSPHDPKELGLFIKYVIVEGAAAKDGRLQLDDQLLEVNGECLLNHSNTEATRILRFALQKEISHSGYAKIIVARKKGGTFQPQVQHNYATANMTKKQGQLTSCCKGPTALQELQKQNGLPRVFGSRSLHNMSYHQAVDSALLSGISATLASDPLSVVGFAGDHDFSERACVEVKRSQPSGNTENSDSERNGKSEVLSWDCKNLDVTQDTSSSDSEARPVFQREGFGRQSMSEKRKGHLDPRTTEVYQKIRQNKGRFCSASLDRNRTKSKPFEDNGISAEETNSSLALKKSTSLESLKAAYPDSDPVTETPKGPVDSQGRPCGTNNSFRSAVDRSYAKNLDADETTLNEAETNISSNNMSNPNDRTTGSKDSVESQDSKKNKGRGPFKVISDILRLGRRRKENLKADDLNGRGVGRHRDEVKASNAKASQQRGKRTCSDLGVRTQYGISERHSSDKSVHGMACNSDRVVSRSSSEQKPIPLNSSTKPEDSERLEKICPTSSRLATPADQIDQLFSTSAPSRGTVGMEIPPLDLSDRRCPSSQEKVSTESPSMSRLMQLRDEHQRYHHRRHHQYPIDAQEEYELKLCELEQQIQLSEPENFSGSSSIQYRARIDMSDGSRNSYLERPMSCGHNYQNIDIVRSQLQLHEEYQLRYQAQLRSQQQILRQQQQQQQLHQQQQQPMTMANLAPVHHQYSKSYSPQPLGCYPSSASPAVFCSYQVTPGVLQNFEAIPMTMAKQKHFPGPWQHPESIPLALQNHQRTPGPLQNCNANLVGSQNFEGNSQALSNYDNRSYKWNQVRDLSQNPFPSGQETGQRAILGHRRYYSGFASHSPLPTGFEYVFRDGRNEHYYSSGEHSVSQRHHYKY